MYKGQHPVDTLGEVEAVLGLLQDLIANSGDEKQQLDCFALMLLLNELREKVVHTIKCLDSTPTSSPTG